MKKNPTGIEGGPRVQYTFGIIILVGGRSSRFGQDKGLYVWQGRPIIVHMLAELKKLDYPICIVCFDDAQVTQYKRTIPTYTADLTFVTNSLAPPYPPEVRAPIIGAAAGFKNLLGMVDAAFLFSCDIPLIKANVVQYVSQRYAGQDAIIPCWDETHFLEPLLALYQVERAHSRAIRAIEKQKWKLLRLIWGSDAWETVSIETELLPLDPQEGTFANFNYLGDLEKKRARKGK